MSKTNPSRISDQQVESSIENDDEHVADDKEHTDDMLKRLIEVHGPAPEKKPVDHDHYVATVPVRTPTASLKSSMG
jgi:hypothetical protein